MKCEDFQDQLWYGERDPDFESHYKTCRTCQSEMIRFQDLLNDMRIKDIPLPTRNLKPNRAVIRKSVRMNRLTPWSKKVGLFAASLVILVSAGLVVQGIDRSQTNEKKATLTELTEHQTSTNQNKPSPFQSQKITLPDGQVLTGLSNPITYQGVELMFQEGYDNHALVQIEETVQTQIGPVKLAHVEKSNPAADDGKKSDTYYWLIYQRDDMPNPFILSAKYTEDRDKAKQAILQAAKTWEIPSLTQ
ncbi:hypothetical protein JJB07_21615 [Tumebacillus sp. ITR2]|uniref:Zinc-finger domain-containing protein n=1 Tax=Tumebacillus amylolyticus TaxID=2801339 RepID=A0ABS1JG43_9BACL|nr:hypothetical protein [Tumebacillus amylolyticus]MBL0389195.1 hypothetical protein [Tumebacillus amylolyticus]